MTDEPREATNAEANLFFETELTKIHDASFSTLRAASSLKDARLMLMVSTMQEILRMDNIKEIQSRLAIALNTDRQLEGTLRLRSDADKQRLETVYQHNDKIMGKEPPKSTPPPLPIPEVKLAEKGPPEPDPRKIAVYTDTGVAEQFPELFGRGKAKKGAK